MKIHNYSPTTGEYLNTTVADESPLEPGIFMIPALATDMTPPTLKANEVAVFSAGVWVVVPDYRSQTVYDKTTGAAVQITDLGALAANLVVEKPKPTQAQIAAQLIANQTAALAAIDQFAAATLATLTGNVPEVSARTWEMEWGLALLINNAAYTFDPRQSAFLTSQGLNPAPKIAAEKAALAAYAVKVIAKGTAFSTMASLTKSLQNSSKAAVLAAIDQPALDAAIAANKAAAQAAIAALPKV